MAVSHGFDSPTTADLNTVAGATGGTPVRREISSGGSANPIQCVGGASYAAGTGGDAMYTWPGGAPASREQTGTLVFEVIATGIYGPVALWQGSGTYYRILANRYSGSLDLQRVNSHTIAPNLASTPFTFWNTEVYTLSFETNVVPTGLRFRVWLSDATNGPANGGAPLIDVIDTTPLTAPGEFGVYVAGDSARLRQFDAASTAPPAPALTGNIVVDDAAPSGTLQSSPPSTLTGNVTTDGAAPTGSISSGAAPGTVLLSGWDNLSGMPLPNEPVARITLQRLSDGVQVLNVPGLTTSANPTTPAISITNAALVPGTFYLAIANNADGTVLGVERVQAT